MKNIISIKGLEPSNEVTPRTYTWLDTKYVKLPNVVGLSKKDASKKLKGFDIIYSGTGDTVMYQEPKEGTYVKENATIKIMMN